MTNDEGRMTKGGRSQDIHSLVFAQAEKSQVFLVAAALIERQKFISRTDSRRRSSIRCTPAMAAGVTNSPWTVRDLVGMIEA